jgi:hypothetical protein
MNPDPSKILEAFNDIGVRVSLGIAGTVAAGAAVVVPNGKQVNEVIIAFRCRCQVPGRRQVRPDASPNGETPLPAPRSQVEATSLEMYGREPTQLLPNERGAAVFCAGYRRWKGFVEHNIYSWTRKLPGHDSPIVNPYKGPRRIPRPQPKAEEQPDAETAKE